MFKKLSTAALTALVLFSGSVQADAPRLIDGRMMTQNEHHMVTMFITGKAFLNVYRPKLNSFTTEQLTCLYEGLREWSWTNQTLHTPSSLMISNEERCTGNFLSVPKELLESPDIRKEPEGPGV